MHVLQIWLKKHVPLRYLFLVTHRILWRSVTLNLLDVKRFTFPIHLPLQFFLLCLLPKPWNRETVYHSPSCIMIRIRCNSSVFVIMISVKGVMLKKVLHLLMRLTKKKAIPWVLNYFSRHFNSLCSLCVASFHFCLSLFILSQA